jgi:hypothetical protein
MIPLLGRSRAVLNLVRYCPLVRSVEQIAHFFIASLGKILVPEPDRMEWLRRDRTDNVVNVRSHLVAGFGRRNRNGHYNTSGLLLSQRFDGREHGGAGCEAIVYKYDSLATHIEGRTIATVKALTPPQLLLLFCGDRIDEVVWDAESEHHLVVKNADAARRDRAHGQLIVPGNT